jgi:hypothetical protein
MELTREESMSAPESVARLIETFGHNLDFYKSDRYNEAQLRQEFLDPFFRELGWDMDNAEGLAPQYRDVIHEASIKIGGSTKAPDYAFSIHGQYKFFLEAKKPSVNVHDDTDPAYQLRRYGWSAKLPISILTDFEEFAIYDCRKRPKRGERASTARLGYFKYTDYIDKWDELCGTFSKQAILKGSFDRYTVDSKRHRGTDTVDDVFLEEIEHWRSLLAKNFALRNPHLSVRDLNFAVQKTIDRLIFLRICEDRGTEDYKRLASLLNGGRIYPRLLDLFMQADDRYNSGLFHFSVETGRSTPDEITPNLDLDDKVLKEIISKLYYPESPYEFSVLPADILGQVYEQFLGKTIHLTATHQAKIEEKPEVRKAGGVYYTPSYIVDYIVKNTLGRLLDGDNPQKPKPIAVTKAADIKVLDPACGSGSFLIVAYQYLLDWHLRQYTADAGTNEPDDGKMKRHSGGKSPRIYQAPGGEWKLTTDERKRILLNNIHGVDIDAQAVEVTKLSLLLKVIEGETQQVLQRDWIRERQRILPDLENNIKCGNSLIGPDFYDNEQMLLLDEETQYRINVFNWKTAFPEIMQRGGFDCVIGNPPYIRIQSLQEYAPQESEFYAKAFLSAREGNFDIYVCFIEQALRLLNSAGLLGYIVPHKFFQATYGKALRELLSTGFHTRQIISFGAEQVFEQATTYTCLYFASKKKNQSIIFQRAYDLPAWRSTNEPTADTMHSASLGHEPWHLLNDEERALLHRLLPLGSPLSEHTTSITQGLKTGADPVFVLEVRKETNGNLVCFSPHLREEVTIERDATLPLAKGGDMLRYTQPNPRRRVLFPYDDNGNLIPGGELKVQSPLAWKYLEDCREKLNQRERGRFAGASFYQFSRAQCIRQSCLPKILTPDIAPAPRFAVDGAGQCAYLGGAAGGYGVIVEDQSVVPFLIGILNSLLMEWFISSTSSVFRGGWFSYESRFISAFPVRAIDFDNPDDVAKHDKIVGLVERMLELNKKKAAENNPETRRLLETQIAATDRQIDRLVYDLYNLTDDEITLVEGTD